MSPEQLLGELNGDSVVIADLEAGVGTLSRLPEGGADMLIVVVEPTLKSIEVGQRIVALASRRHPGSKLILVGNRVGDPSDAERIRAAFEIEPVVVPDDPGIAEADRHGLSPLDASPQSAGTRALVGLARLVP